MSEEVISADELLLRAQGHKGELPRQFSTLAMLSLAFSITNSWIGYSAVFITPLLCGGGPGVFFGLLVAAVACSLINAGLAELASAYPSSGGQYHFAYMVSSEKHRAVAAFIMGWLSVIAWCLTTASASIFCAQMIGNLATFFNPTYVATQWQVYLVYVLVMILSTAIVCFLPRAIPKGEIAFFICNITAFCVFFITCLAVSHGRQSSRVVFTEYVNQTGWSNGMAFMLGVGQAMYTFVATDAGTHMAEELPDPGRNIPRVILYTMIIGIVTSFLWTIAFMFSTTDLTAVSASALPILTVYSQALNNHSAATFFMCWYLWIYFGAVISCIATTGRLAWAFARDNGLPFSPTFARVNTTFAVPINATAICAVAIILYGAIYVGSTTAFNSFISMSILSLNVTYAAPQGILLLRGRSLLPSTRHFSLGPVFGPLCNAFSVAWVSLYTVLFCFPVFTPTTPQTMNYVSVVVAGIVAIVAGAWFGGKRKSFVGPEIHIEGIEEALAMRGGEGLDVERKGNMGLAK
ncbi:putative amino acid permease [Lophium mytilinum]|uniref:Putative amino acid permease n=1 Tax=Lophium mytilinum TaxID=390894 RepID=A0A6A6QVR6_9PEZI|nr:putative amino acid permease [Lophium mytilinum]